MGIIGTRKAPVVVVGRRMSRGRTRRSSEGKPRWRESATLSNLSGAYRLKPFGTATIASGSVQRDLLRIERIVDYASSCSRPPRPPRSYGRVCELPAVVRLTIGSSTDNCQPPSILPTRSQRPVDIRRRATRQGAQSGAQRGELPDARSRPAEPANRFGEVAKYDYDRTHW